MTPTGVGASGRLIRLHQQAEVLADRLPPLLVAAERVAATVAQGVHGRRRVGVGDTFWQFRPYQPGDSTSRIDWRQSARSTQLFLRDQEWEAAETVWLWADASGSMAYSSTSRVPTKQDRALLLLLALASLLTRAGERIALLGDQRRPTGGRAGGRPHLRAAGRPIRRPASSMRPDPAAAAACAPGAGQRLLHSPGGAARTPARLRGDGHPRPPAPGARSGGAEPAVRRPGAVRGPGERRRHADRQCGRRPDALSRPHRGATVWVCAIWRAAWAGRSPATSPIIRPSRRCWPCTTPFRPRARARPCSRSAGSA